MRSIIAAVLMALALVRADVIVRWDFNSAEPDGDGASGSFVPKEGEGDFLVIGARTNNFGSVAAGGTSDPNRADNSQLRITQFPAQGTASGTAGIQLRASTGEFRNVRVTWDHYNSPTASRFWLVQYTTDGLTWLDHEVFTNTNASVWLNRRSVSFAAVPGVNDNPDFGVRIVAQFGEDDRYAAVGGGNYSTAGTWWLDMLALEGDSMDATNQPPNPVEAGSVVTRWDFNSSEPDGDASTGNALGVTVVGVATNRFGSVASGATSDPHKSDNSMLLVSGFPGRASNNKSAGVEFRASTVGRTNLAVIWDQYNSNTASRYWRIQYSTNGADFWDHLVITNRTASRWHLTNTVSFAGVSGTENNPNFAFRIVAEFEDTATGAGEPAYRGVNETSNYGTTGTLWLDMVTLIGNEVAMPNPTNTTPRLTLAWTSTNTTSGAIVSLPFIVDDTEQPPADLILTLVSDRIPVDAIEISGEGTARQLIVSLPPNLSGAARITLAVSDGVLTNAVEVLLLINSPPIISLGGTLFDAVAGVPIAIPFTIADAEQTAESLTVTAAAENLELTVLMIEGSGAVRILKIVPPHDSAGTFTIILSLSDGELTASAQVAIHVSPPEPPVLGITRVAGLLRLSWDQASFRVEQTSAASGADWESVIDPVTSEDGKSVLVVPPDAEKRFFRLRQ